ncbi:restriction endonuclease subunit S [Chryseobacterium caseinilyticum]|uniref:Restriction endonuclease subunit S n=1 Tax=Chryseobacterium caseinilyticum TaxID=2771428 RepID=A0ABR8Z6S3_9FLAO|nr:restriction endonuclease subunit S [Chryseobacterium caseinilyticum]MBD8080907.1 restriction endonuclease subunit S [Chryseobacterium caseinilyticum]
MIEENKSVKNFPNSRNVPKLRFSEFINNWEIYYLKEIAEKINNKNNDNRIVTVFSNSAVQGIVLQSDFFDKSIANKNNLDGYYIVEPFDFVYNPRLSSTAEVGAMSVNKTNLIGLVSPLYTVFKIKDKNINISFLEYLFKSKVWHNYMRSIANYGAREDRMNVRSEDFYNLPLTIPNFSEQTKVSRFLSLIDSRIQTQKKIIEGLSLQKISLVKKLFENKIKFKTNNKTRNWERKKLSEISEEHLHKNPNNKYNEVFSVAKHKGVINQIEHLGRSFSAKEILHYKLVYSGDLVYTKSPTSDFPFGIIKQNRTGRIGVVSPLYCVFKPQTYALGYLLHEYFNSSVNTFNYLNPLVQKGAKNTMNINNETFLNGASILLPMNEEEQEKIYKFLLTLDEKINLERELLTQYENQKKYLLQNLFL